MSSALTESERVKLGDLELIIERGLRTFVQVGAALHLIREQRLYRASHDSFEAYCQERWGWTRGRSNQLIRAAETVQKLDTDVSNPPANEAQARQLARVAEADRQSVWERVLVEAETLPDGDPIVTADLVRRVVDRHLEPPKPKPAPRTPSTAPRPKKAAPPKSKVDQLAAQRIAEAQERDARIREARARAEAPAETVIDEPTTHEGEVGVPGDAPDAFRQEVERTEDRQPTSPTESEPVEERTRGAERPEADDSPASASDPSAGTSDTSAGEGEGDHGGDGSGLTSRSASKGADASARESAGALPADAALVSATREIIRRAPSMADADAVPALAAEFGPRDIGQLRCAYRLLGRLIMAIEKGQERAS